MSPIRDVFCHQDDALLDVMGELALDLKQLKTIPNFELGVRAIERPIFLQGMFVLYHDIEATMSRQSTSRHT